MNRTFSILAFVLCLVVTSVRADDGSDRATALRQLRTLGSLFNKFQASHEGRFPKTLDELVTSAKWPDPALLIAPMARDKAKASYELVVSSERLSQVANPARTILVRSRYKLSDGRIPVLFVDGHVELLEASVADKEA